MKKLFAILLLFTFYSCGVKIVPLKGHYLDKPYEIATEKNFDQVWDKVVDFFSQKGLYIRLIDRTSGLIVSGKSQLIWTYERKNGLPLNSNAWVVVEKQIDKSTGDILKPYVVYGDWNVRIKSLPDGRTNINVNLVNILAKRLSNNPAFPTEEVEIEAVSTGNFEKLIADYLK